MSEIEELERIARLDRGNASHYLRLALVAEREGDIPKSRNALKRAWLLAPDDETIKTEVTRLFRWNNLQRENSELLEQICSTESSMLSSVGKVRQLLDRLLEISHPDSVQALLDCGLSAGRPKWFRRETALAVGRMRIPAAVSALLELEAGGNAPGELVLEAMTETGSPAVFDKLTSALEQPVPRQVTARLIIGIGRIATGKARDFLINRQARGHPSEMAAIIEAMSFCAEEPDMAIALRFANSDSEQERAASVMLFAAIGTPESEGLIVGRLEDEAAEVIAAAARGVAAMGIGSALPRLRRLIVHWNEAVRHAIVDALGKVGEMEDITLLESFADRIGYGAIAVAARTAARELRTRLSGD
ncbi:MAG: HEAT repeat domain-containing protein [Planctomycetota bacterium]|jgi:HEAT repeat protein